jgi:hypothetical protein
MTFTVYLFHHLISCARARARMNERRINKIVFSKNRRVECDKTERNRTIVPIIAAAGAVPHRVSHHIT